MTHYTSGALALCSTSMPFAAMSKPGTAGDDKSGERRLGAAAWIGLKEEDGDRWIKRPLKASDEPLLEEVGVGYGLDGEAVVRSPRRRQARLQPQPARAAFACLSQLV